VGRGGGLDAAMTPSRIGKKFVSSYPGEGTLPSAVRSADAKMSMAKLKRRKPWAAVFCYG
jgi:hypothetical protein